MIGINSPELAHDGEPEQCGAKSARDFLRMLRGQTIRIVHDVIQAKPDQYDRTLAYVRHDGLDVGAEQDRRRHRTRVHLRQQLLRAAQRVRPPPELRLFAGQGTVGSVLMAPTETINAYPIRKNAGRGAGLT